jgi:hypothetical protein
MAFTESFYRRHGYAPAPKEITIREDAPEGLRAAALEILRSKSGWKPSALRDIIGAVLRVRSDPGSWSEYPNIWDEVQRLVYECEWFKVYDIIQTVSARFAVQDRQRGGDDAQYFANGINAVFLEDGIGWQVLDGEIAPRGPEAFESVVKEATAALDESDSPTAAAHLHDALQCLSRRPADDLPGAIYHAMGSMECLAAT